MATVNKYSDTDVAEDLNDFNSDSETTELDIEVLTEDEDEEEEVPVKEKWKSQLNKGSPANDRRSAYIIKVFKFICLTTKQFIGVFEITDKINYIFRGKHPFQEQLFGSIICSEALHNDRAIEEQSMDIEQCRQSATPPSSFLLPSLLVPLPQIS